MTEKKAGSIYIVLGMHRSGTSLIAGLLHKAGIIMGEENNFLPRPNIENPKGFFENYKFRKINDEILERSGYIVKRWNPFIDCIEVSYFQKKRMKRLIANNSRKFKRWGWKDPRQMLTNHLWFQAINELKVVNKVKYIIVFRHPLSVAISMQKRGNIETISHGIALWFLYNHRAVQFLDKYKPTCLFLSYEHFFDHPRMTMERLSSYLRIAISEDLYDSFVTTDLVRSDYRDSPIAYDFGYDEKVKKLLDTLNEYALVE